ncbi:DUF6916 family protein [Lichenibacterium dinghuense]|uniref:DUF6916 family protein n=1 Tax=Lichenibacterium dinghuense TaxID=2895977 RepID=UPI001F2B47F5|nr:hypothetical protein [Lichenibacterium sp. 6Y81]
MPTFDNLLTIEDFAPYLGSAFQVDATPKAVDVRLDQIERYPHNPLNLREPFTLFFSTPFSALLVAGTYRMRARDGRVIEIDLNPTQTMPGPRRTYHAVFT